MYTNLSLYYLNLIGITPWVTRSRKNHAVKLAVVLPPSQSKKAKNLLKNMLDFVGLSADTVRIIHDAKPEDLKTLDTSSLLAVLLLGFDASKHHFSCPLFDGADPEMLIKNPLHKKQMVKALLSLKEHLSRQGQ